MKLPRTQEEIAARCRTCDSLFGFSLEVLVPALDFEHAKEFLKPGAGLESWAPLTAADIKVEASIGLAGWGNEHLEAITLREVTNAIIRDKQQRTIK